MICVPTFRRPEMLRATLESLVAQQTSVAFAVVVVDNDAEAKEGLGIARAFFADGRLKGFVATEDRQGNVHAINAAFGMARVAFPAAEYFLMIDDDEIAAPIWLDQMIAAARRDNADVVGGPVFPIFPADVKAAFRDHPVYWPAYTKSGPVPMIYGTGNCLITRRVFEGLANANFDPAFNFLGGGDTEFFTRCRKAGFKFHWCHEASISEQVTPNRLALGWVLRRSIATGVINYRIDRLAAQTLGRPRATRRQEHRGRADIVAARRANIGGAKASVRRAPSDRRRRRSLARVVRLGSAAVSAPRSRTEFAALSVSGFLARHGGSGAISLSRDMIVLIRSMLFADRARENTTALSAPAIGYPALLSEPKHPRATPTHARSRSSRIKRIGQPSSPRLRQQHHESDWICREIANGEAPGLQEEPESPFEPRLLQPARSTRLRARDEIEQPTRRLDYFHVRKASRVARDEFLFQRHAKREPQYVGRQRVDLRELRIERLAIEKAMRAAADVEARKHSPRGAVGARIDFLRRAEKIKAQFRLLGHCRHDWIEIGRRDAFGQTVLGQYARGDDKRLAVGADKVGVVDQSGRKPRQGAAAPELRHSPM